MLRRDRGLFSHGQQLEVGKVQECLCVFIDATVADGEDDGDSGGYLRSVLVATTLRHARRRHQPRRLDLSTHPGRLDRSALAGDEQLLLQPVRLLLDELQLPGGVPAAGRHGCVSWSAAGRRRTLRGGSVLVPVGTRAPRRRVGSGTG